MEDETAFRDAAIRSVVWWNLWRCVAWSEELHSCPHLSEPLQVHCQLSAHCWQIYQCAAAVASQRSIEMCAHCGSGDGGDGGGDVSRQHMRCVTVRSPHYRRLWRHKLQRGWRQ